MNTLFDFTKTNISYYTVPAAFLLAHTPHFIGSIAAGRNYELANPRRTREHCERDESMDKETRLMIRRALAATDNGIESIGFYAAAVVAANSAGVPVADVNALTLGYLASRVGYNVVYVYLQKNRKMAPLRSVFWIASTILMFTLFVKAGNAARA